MFILRDSIVEIIRADYELRTDLSKALDLRDDTIVRAARKNQPNGPLTLYAALQVLNNKTGLSFEKILVDSEELVSTV